MPLVNKCNLSKTLVFKNKGLKNTITNTKSPQTFFIREKFLVIHRV